MKREKRIPIRVVKEERRKRRRTRARSRRRRLFVLVLVGSGAYVALARAGGKSGITPGSGTVTYRDEQPGPLASVLGELVKGYMKFPEKKAIADRLSFSIAIQDLDNPEMAATLTFKGSDVTVSNGVEPGTDVYVGTELELLLGLAGMGRGGQVLKFFQSEEGRKIIEAFRRGRFKVQGAVQRPVQMLQFQKFLAPPS